MNPAAFGAALAEVGGEALWRTNPVLCVDRLLTRWERSDAEWATGAGRLWNLLTTLADAGVWLPSEALNRWAARSHAGRFRASVAAQCQARVVGLAVSADGRTGYVFPLRPTLAPEWRIDAELPFKGHEIQDGLAALIQESGIPDAGAVPERLAFEFDNPTGLTARGDSMRMAATLSVLDHLGGHSSPLLRAAVVLVEPQSGGRLRSVSNIPEKLRAARRECGRLSLVVGPPGVVDNASGEVVWEVGAFADLARHLHGAGLLAPLLDAAGPLTRSEVSRVLERLRSLVVRESRYRDAADLGERVRRCDFAAPPDPSAWVEFARLHAQAYRHHGRFADAVTVGGEAHKRVAGLGDRGCDDEEADSAAEYAASLFSGHRFAEIPCLLHQWTELAAREPRRFRPLTRVKVWNTLARALSILKRDGWDELFGRSLELHRQLDDSENINRTTHYRVHARLCHGNTAGAKSALEEAPGLSETAGAGNPWVAFLHANLARFEMREWADPGLDKRLEAGEQPYSAWVYVQATARQSRRDREDSLRRLERALALLRHEAGGAEGNVCNLFAAFLDLYGAARSHDSRRWETSGAEARRFLSSAPDHQAHYGAAVGALPTSPCLPASEALLRLVPYF